MENKNLANVADKIPGSICEILIDDQYTLCYANQYFYEMCGYSFKSTPIATVDNYAKIIHPDDISSFRRVLVHALEGNLTGFEHEHRILCQNGNIQWSLLRGSFGENDDKICAYCVSMDITNRREIEESLRINEERFHIALSQTDNAIFDYDIKEKRMLHADKAAERFGINTSTENVPEALIENGVVHMDTAKPYLEMYSQIQNGAPFASCDIKTRLSSGKYVWRKINMTNVFDTSGCAVRAIGILEDINDQKNREKLLLERSERDLLTGIFNKCTTEHHIDAYLQNHPNHFSAFLMIDLDNFKGINDRYGHLFGDRVLIESARRIVSLFREIDIIGRVGGDEFVIFMSNIPSIQKLEQRAKQLCSAFVREFIFGDICSSLSCSVGIALIPKDGLTFFELYQKADIALYKAKFSGKNRYHIFDHSTDFGGDSFPIFEK